MIKGLSKFGMQISKFLNSGEEVEKGCFCGGLLTLKQSAYTKVLKVHRHCSLPPSICRQRQRWRLLRGIMDPVHVVTGQAAIKEIGYRKDL